MGKRILFLMILPVLILALVGVAQAWQGRMGGMEDPYGLVQDESDFLIQPAKIADGQGVRFYGDYSFTYTGVPNWSYSVNWFIPFTAPPILFGSEKFYTSGYEQSHDALAGVAFPLGSGRMGIFFDYDGPKGSYSGNMPVSFMRPDPSYPINLKSNFDAYTLSLLYGLPIGGGFKLGGEAQLGYQQEENEESFYAGPLSLINNPLGSYNPMLPFPLNVNLFPFMLPYDSSYFQALFKGSLEGAIGPLDTEFTVRGGFIFGGENKYNFVYADGPLPTGGLMGSNLEGNVTGWQVGEDLWLRYPLAKGFSLPFLVQVDYQKKTRDGDGWGAFDFTGSDINYKSEETALTIEVGGGIDKELAKGTRLAAGIYYNYLNGADNFWYNVSPFNLTFDQANCPNSTEHQVMLKLAGEHEVSSVFALRGGVNFFYGWVKEDFTAAYTDPAINQYADDIGLSGTHWGIGAALGGSIKFHSFTFEPFAGGGYQVYAVSGNGGTSVMGVTVADTMYLTQKEWLVGGGLSIVFGQ